MKESFEPAPSEETGLEAYNTSELDIEDTNPIQIELTERMGISFEEWASRGYSQTFRILINGYDGPYEPGKDTDDARTLRALYRTDREAFFEHVKRTLEGGR